jgi:cation-transporting ATPase 13A3/4/5
VKGSPEKIQELCDPKTMPGNYDEVLEQYTKEGFRVIGLATKALPNLNYRKAMSIQRNEIEKDLTFLGLLIMENKLKPQTPGAIAKLQECSVRTVMATGDNVLTAISVARQCNIISGEKDVWLADIANVNGQQIVVWKSTSFEVNE